MNFFMLMGFLMLGITYWDYKREETSIDFLFYLWFEISRESMPTLYWLILAMQALAGLMLIYYSLG